jgi:putative transposase
MQNTDEILHLPAFPETQEEGAGPDISEDEPCDEPDFGLGKTGFRLRIYPTRDQENTIRSWFGMSRWMYNSALFWMKQEIALWKPAYNAWPVDQNGDKLPGAPFFPPLGTFQKNLKLWRNKDPKKRQPVPFVNREDGSVEFRDMPWLMNAPVSLYNNARIDLQNAFSRSWNKKLQSGSPQYKEKPVQEYGQDFSGSCRIRMDQRPGKGYDTPPKWVQAWKEGRVEIPGISGFLEFKDSMDLPKDRPKMVTLSRDGTGAWFLSFSLEVSHPEDVAKRQERSRKTYPLPETPKALGFDQNLGSENRLVDSDGKHYAFDTKLKSRQKRLKKLQRGLSRKKRGTARYLKAKKKVATCQGGVANKRDALCHDVAGEAVRVTTIVAMEDLNSKAMCEGKSRGFCVKLQDAAFGQMALIMERKCKKHGRVFLKCHRYDATSKQCSTDGCGHVNFDLKLSDREWVCPKCGTKHQRDTNAAQNILRHALNPEQAELERKAHQLLLKQHKKAQKAALKAASKTPRQTKKSKARALPGQTDFPKGVGCSLSDVEGRVKNTSLGRHARATASTGPVRPLSTG